MSKISIRFYNDHEVRAVWSEEDQKWFFSVLDVLSAINSQNDYKKTRNYWKYLKAKLKKEKSEVVSVTTQLKLTASDGKRYLTDVLDAAGVTMLAKAIPNNNALIFLDWLIYSDNTIDGQSRKKAYTLFESNLLDNIPVGTTDGLQQIHSLLFGGLYDFAGKIRQKTISKGGFTFCPAQYIEQELKRVEQMPSPTISRVARCL